MSPHKLAMSSSTEEDFLENEYKFITLQDVIDGCLTLHTMTVYAFLEFLTTFIVQNITPVEGHGMGMQPVQITSKAEALTLNI